MGKAADVTASNLSLLANRGTDGIYTAMITVTNVTNGGNRRGVGRPGESWEPKDAMSGTRRTM